MNPAPAESPYIPPYSPAPPRLPPLDQATTGQRIAGGLLIANALLLVTELIVLPATPNDHPLTAPQSMILPAIIDMVIGVSLVSGKKRFVPWATLRVAVGTVLFTALQLKDPLMAVIQLAVGAAFLLLLIGDAKVLRIVAGAALFGLYALAEVVGLAGTLLGNNPLRTLALAVTDQLEPGVVHDLTGQSYGYTVHVASDRWRLRKDAIAKKEQPLADRWLLRTDIDAHVMIIAEHEPGKVVLLQPYVDAVLAAGTQDTQDFKVLEQHPLTSLPEDGRFVHATFKAAGQSFDRYYGLIAMGDRGFQILATVDHDHFPEVAPDLAQIVDSFQLPKEALAAALPPDIEREPAGEVTGVSVAYRLTGANPRWHLRKAADAAKDQPLADRWLTRPDRAAHLMVIAEHAPGAVLPIEAYADEIEANAGRAGMGFHRIAREPLRSDPSRGRFLHTTVNINGVALEYYYGLVTTGDRGYQVIGFSEQRDFPVVEAELRQMIESFRPPEGVEKGAKPRR